MRIEKVAILNEVTARVKDSDYCFILNYGGVDVVKIGKFRAALKAHDSRLLIVKNTFLAKAAKEKGWSDEVQAMLTGPTAIVTGKGEVTAVAKDVMDFVNGSDGRASSPRRPRRKVARLLPRNGRAALLRGRPSDFQRMKHGVG